MKFKIDENLPVEVAHLLKEAGHDAMTVLQQQLGGVSPQNKLWIVSENRIRIRE